MAEVLLNGRVPLDWELPVIERGRRCDRDRDLAQLAGLIAEYPDRWPAAVARPVADLSPGLS